MLHQKYVLEVKGERQKVKGLVCTGRGQNKTGLSLLKGLPVYVPIIIGMQ